VLDAAHCIYSHRRIDVELVQGVGCGVWGVGCGVWGLGCVELSIGGYVVRRQLVPGSTQVHSTAWYVSRCTISRCRETTPRSAQGGHTALVHLEMCSGLPIVCLKVVRVCGMLQVKDP
jgi:hypothetical protein